MEIRLGPGGIPMCCKGLSSIDGVRKMAELELSAMQVAFTHSIYMSVDSAKKLGDTASETGVELSVHAPYYINLASDSKRIVDESKKRILDSLERGVVMGADVVVAHAGYYGKDKVKSTQMILEACKEITEIIEKNDWKIEFGLETMGKQASFGTLEEIIELCKKMKHLVPYLDPSHIYARQGGQINFKDMLDKLDVLNLKKIHSHFSGIKYTLVGIGRGNERNHVPMKMAGPDFKEYAKEILKKEKDITIISESPILEIDSLTMKETFEKLGYRF